MESSTWEKNVSNLDKFLLSSQGQGCTLFPKIEFFLNHYLESLSFLWSEMAISGQIWSFLSKKSEFFIKWTQFFIKSAKNGSFL